MAAAPKLAEVLRLLGAERAFVVHGESVDELPLDGSGVLYDVTPAGVERRTVDAAALGLGRVATSRLAGGTAAENATIVEAILRGEPGARRDVVLLNAGAALVVAGVVDDLAAGIDRAALTIDAGLATELLGDLRAERRAADARTGGRAGSAGMTLADRDELERDGPDRLPPPDEDAPDADRVATADRNVVEEIAARRRADIRDEMGRLTRSTTTCAIAEATPPPRPMLDRLAAPGLHLIAEIKRSSPSAGAIAAPDEDIVARARAYEAGGAAAISVLCEPHWFGGSVDDLRGGPRRGVDPRPRQGVRRRGDPAAPPPGGRRRRASSSSPSSTPPRASPSWSSGRSRSAWSRSSRLTTRPRWSGRSQPGPA